MAIRMQLFLLMPQELYRQNLPDVGQKVVKGQVLAQIDDQMYKSQMQGLETQYKFASDMFDKQKRLWDQKIGSEVQYLQSKTTKESLEKQISSLKTSKLISLKSNRLLTEQLKNVI